MSTILQCHEAASTSKPPMQAAEVEDTIKRIASHKGVEGIVICNYDGIALKSTLTPALTAKYSGLLSQLVVKARGIVRTIDADNDLTFLRVRSKKHEIMIAPDKEYLLIVIQNPSAEDAFAK